MTGKLRDGICRAINGEFGGDYRIYTEKIEQRFERPCFFVEVKSSDTQLFRGNRYHMQSRLLVTYYPLYTDKNEDMAKTAQRLSQCLEVTEPDGSPLRCSSCSHTFEKDCLLTDIGFDFFVIREPAEEDSELMWEYKLNFKEG